MKFVRTWLVPIVFLLCAGLLFGCAEDAQTPEEPTQDEALVTVSSKGVVKGLTDAGKAASVLEIPSVFNGVTVTEIDEKAFFECTNLVSVTIPDTVTTIGASAFNGCTGLVSITIPDSVCDIGGYAFHQCTKLTDITLPVGLTLV